LYQYIINADRQGRCSVCSGSSPLDSCCTSYLLNSEQKEKPAGVTQQAYLVVV